MGWLLPPSLVDVTHGVDLTLSIALLFLHLISPMVFIICFGFCIRHFASNRGLVTNSAIKTLSLALLWDILAMYVANPNMTSYILVDSYSGMHSRVYIDANRHVFWLFRLEDFYYNLVMANTRLTRGLAYIRELFLDDLDMIIIDLSKQVFKAWLPFVGQVRFNATFNDGPASRTRSKVWIMSHPLTPPPRVSQEGLPEQPRVKDNNPLPESELYLGSSLVPTFFKNPDRAIPVPKVVAPEALQVRDDKYYDALNNSLVPPSQGEIEEQQDFLATIYKVIEDKLAKEEGIYLASDAEVSDNKWQPLAPDADLPVADIISQEWAQTHSHSEFLWEQAQLNNIAAATWRFWWSANPPNRIQYPDLYAEWNKIEDYCRVTTQTWYNIRFKELKEDTAKALGLDPISFKKITTSTEWLADEFERADFQSKHTSTNINTIPETMSQISRCSLRSQPTTPENRDSIDIRTLTPRKIKERLESIPSDITSLEYIDEPVTQEQGIKQEPQSPKDVEMTQDTQISKDVETLNVIVNPAPILHRERTELVAEISTSEAKDKGKGKETEMDTSEDFATSDETYHMAPSTLSAKLQDFTKGVKTMTTIFEDKMRRSHTPISHMSNGTQLLNFMDIAKENLSRKDRLEFHKEIAQKGSDARSAYLEIMLNGLFLEAVDQNLHQGHYLPIKDVYNNFNDPLEKFEDQIESIEKDKILFAILPYKLYGDLLVHWLVTRKYIKQAIKVPSNSSMEKVTWSYLNALFDHRFKDMLSEADFIHCVKGLHGILDETVQSKYDIENFGKEGIDASMHAPKTGKKTVEKIVEKIVYVEKKAEEQSGHSNLTPSSEPSLLQQRKLENRSSMKLTSYDKAEVKDILMMASQLSEKLDIPITEAFDKAEDILLITQMTGRSTSRSRSRSRGRQPQSTSQVIQQPWHTVNDPQKITDLAMTIKVLLDAKPKVPKKKVPVKLTKLDKLSPVSLGTPTDDYNIMTAKQNLPSGSQV
ncbi:hypothetical protein AX15_005233 [Amanita polypyramis BW_CC]|nr:hypothetical protein AX15_005233 [Amanita polypyramis BW_CC]